MLVITGPGRCGTSCLAAVLHRAGCDPGGEWHPRTELRAGWEAPQIVRINTAILEGRADEMTDARIQAADRPVIKDPRFTINGARALKRWWRLRRDLRVLLLLRDPAAILDSMLAHADHFRGVADVDPGVLREVYWRRGVDTAGWCLRAGVPLRLLIYPDWLHQYNRVERTLLGFGALPILPAVLHAAWERVIDPSLVRF